MPTSQRNSQNFRAIGACSCSLYALDSNIFNPLPEPLTDKMLNFTAMIAIISQKEYFLYIKIKKMQNIPRIFLNQKIESGKSFAIDKDIVHYLRRVMRRDDCLVFNNGEEYAAKLSADDKFVLIGDKTEHLDPSNDLTLYFAPIKKLDDLINMVTQMGVGTFVPVLTNRTVANHVNWTRIRKIMIEASEQSGRNSIPVLAEPIKFDDLDLKGLIVADERFAHGKEEVNTKVSGKRLLVGPEGGFSDAEFGKMDGAGVIGLSLGKTILRAETAAVVATAKVLS
jgi:16S rRNA (uracil1498-N3)-methyltransferase